MLQIQSMKSETRKMKIRPIADADVFHVPLSQHIGSPAVPVVKCGEHILQYQIIGAAGKGCSANIHAPVSGVVLGVEDIALPGGMKSQAVIIQNDHKNECAEFDGTDVSVPGLLRQGGIVGEGGAQFPTALKYSEDERGKLNVLIVNGTECEPYLSADYALMAERTESVLRGTEILRSFMRIPEVVIVMEEQNKDLEQVFAPFLEKEEYWNYRIQLLPDTYPQGGELQVIRSVTGIEIPRGTLPKEAGVVVNNVGTVYSVYNAVERHLPLISRVVTVSGEEAGTYGNFEVKIGTPVSHILKELNISSEGKNVILGGPMMGKYVSDTNVPVMKGSSGILLLKDKNERRNHCISCGYCVEVCPMHLMPMKFEDLMRKGRYKALAEYGLNNCIECAACEYVCPSNVALIENIKRGKMMLKQLSNGTK